MPANVCRIRIEAIGAAGGEGGTAGTPGAGAWATASFVVMPGETLFVHVGGEGGAAAGPMPGDGGWNGGGAGGRAFDGTEGRPGKAGSGGGGATDVRRGGDGLDHRIIVAGGGSGGAGGAIGGPIGTASGDGGDLAGQDGFAALGSANPATGGKGGSQTMGGAPGTNGPDLSITATAGSLGVGGNGASGGISGGGGGGGGLYGGGGGGSTKSPTRRRPRRRRLWIRPARDNLSNRRRGQLWRRTSEHQLRPRHRCLQHPFKAQPRKPNATRGRRTA